MMKQILLFLLFLTMSVPLFSNTDSGTNDSKNLIGFEINIPPHEYVYDATITFSVWKYGDIITGFIHQTVDDQNGGDETENSLMLGYRQFLWNGLFLSLEFRPTRYDFDYSSNDISIEGNQLILQSSLGYRFDINILNQEIYILPVIHVRKDVYKENEWPEYKNRGLMNIKLMIGFRI